MTWPRPRHVILGALIASGLALALGVATLNSDWAARRVKREAVAMIVARFDGRVEVGAMSLSLFPRVAVSGTNLRLTRNGTTEPFLTIQRFDVSGSPLALLKRGASTVEITGLELRVTRGRKMAADAMRAAHLRDVRIGTVHVLDGRLLIVPDNPDKQPLEFDLHEVTVTDFGFDRSSPYSARLTNPKPLTVIQSEGHIGPWNTWSPRETPLSGVYLFNDAQLDTIKGIGGHLTSSGRFEGVLERIHVEGTTTSTDFQLQLARQPVPLQTQFKATVDGTRGDTDLDEVKATLGASRIDAHGSVSGTRGVKGRTVSLQLSARKAHFEDLLRLAVKAAEPPMRGLLDLDTTFELPPGDTAVPERLILDGRFRITNGRFASDTTQDKVDELSRRGRGEPENEAVANVLSAFGGSFTLKNGLLTLPRVQFSVRGARVDIDGDYRLQTEALNFAGQLTLDAPLSHTVTGFKSVLLKAVDPFFKKGSAGTRLPIKVAGTIDKPEFGLDMKRALTRD